MATILEEEHSYRRGLVLGFTLAEIVVLVIFLLLMALATLLARKEEELAERTRELERAEARAAGAMTELQRVVEALGGRDAFDDNFKVLVESREAIEALRAEKRALEEQIARLIDIEGMLASTGSESSEALETFIADAAAGRTLREAQAETNLAGAAPFDVVALALRADASAREASTLKGQVQNLRNRLSAGGRGTEYPPCWAEPETGRIEYIFDVALSAQGFVVRERELPHRSDDRKELPLGRVTTGQRIDAATFLEQFEPLYAWSVQHECRFFVRAFDQTGPTEKEIYKRQMRVLESRFYKYEVLNEAF